MRHRWLMALVLILLLAGVAPTHAEIVTVEPPGEEDEDGDDVREPLLDEEAVEKIARLQRTVSPFILSPVSPDDQAVLSAYVRPTEDDQQEADVFFLNIQDGTTVPANDLVEQILPLSNIVWASDTTAALLALDQTFTPALVGVDRGTGAVFPLKPVPDLPGFPISLAPDASGVLLVLFPEEELPEDPAAPEPVPEPTPAPAPEPVPEPEERFLRSPFDIELQIRPPMPAQPRLNPLSNWQGEDTDDSMEVASDQIEFAYYNLGTGETIPLFSAPENSGLLSAPAWSPDGRKLALVRLTLEIEVSSRGEASLADLITKDALGILPPEYNALFQGNVVDIIDLSGGDVQQTQLRAADGNGDMFINAAWSADGNTLLTQMNRPGQLTGRTFPIYTPQFAESSYVRFYDAATQQVTGVLDAPEISAANFTVPLFVSPAEVIFSTINGLSFQLYYYNRDTGEFSQMSNREGFYTQVTATRASRQLVYGFSSFQNPPELYRIGWQGDDMAQLSYQNVEVAELNAVQVNQVSFTMQSGAVRQGYLIQPEGAAFPPQNEPIVFWQEGGPGGAMFNRWAANVENPYNLLPNFGLSVVMLPLQGRYGWGPDFYNDLADEGNFGSIDIDEGAQAVRQMIERGYTSSDRLGITGCSYGGYFATQSIVRHPDLYAAAVTQCTLLDTITEWQTGFTALLSYLIGGTPAALPDMYVQASPGFQVEAIQTPTLIFHGEFDFLPLSIVKSFHESLEAQDVPVRMLVFEQEGHGLASLENQQLAAQEQITWFRRYLLDEAAAEEPSATAEPEEPTEPAAEEPTATAEPEEPADQETPMPEPTTPDPGLKMPAIPGLERLLELQQTFIQSQNSLR